MPDVSASYGRLFDLMTRKIFGNFFFYSEKDKCASEKNNFLEIRKFDHFKRTKTFSHFYYYKIILWLVMWKLNTLGY